MKNADIILMSMADGGSIRDYWSDSPMPPSLDGTQNLQDMCVCCFFGVVGSRLFSFH